MTSFMDHPLIVIEINLSDLGQFMIILRKNYPKISYDISMMFMECITDLD